MGTKNSFSSIDVIHKQLTRHRYISDQSLATVLYLSYHLSKPIFLEGEPGVGKTEVALVLADILSTELIRLQCYEGLDANSALYDGIIPNSCCASKWTSNAACHPKKWAR
jgi:MoxR-like ATPase